MLSAVAGVGSVMRPRRIGNLWADTTKSGLWILFTGDAVPLSGLARCLGKYYSEPSWTHLRKLFVAFEWSSQAQFLEFLIFLLLFNLFIWKCTSWFYCWTYHCCGCFIKLPCTENIWMNVAVFSKIKGTLLYHTSKPLHTRYFHSGISERRIDSFSQNYLLRNVAFLLMVFLKTQIITETSKGCQRMLFTARNQLALAQWHYCV